MVVPELLALGGAALSALGTVTMKIGLRTSARETVVFVTLLVQALVFGSLTILTDSRVTVGTTAAILAFVAAGLIGSVVARFLITTSVDLIGAARATPVRTTSPVFSAVIAVTLFDERVSELIAAGTLLVVIGLVVLTYEAYQDRETVTDDGYQVRFLVPVFVGSLLLGITPSLRKFGLDAGISVYGGLALNFTTALVVFGAYYFVSHRQALFAGDGLPWFVGTGACWSLAFWCYFTALQTTATVVVVPLFTTTPLFVIVLSWLFLGDIERVTPAVSGGAVAAVVGAVLVVIG
jgi:drug/metabolite transporter (DMT)-like permease